MAIPVWSTPRDSLNRFNLVFSRCPYEESPLGAFSMLALPIFPGRLQPSIVGRSELNFRVRDGNGWTLALISTNYEVYCTFKTEQCIIGNQEGLLPA